MLYQLSYFRKKRTARSFPFPIDSEIQATRSALFLSGK